MPSPRDRKLDSSEILVGIVALILALSGLYQLFSTDQTVGVKKRGRVLGSVLRVSGEVQVKAHGSFVWRKASMGSSLSEGDALRTGEKSLAIVDIDDGPVDIKASSLIVFRGETGRGPSFELVFGEAEKNQKPVEVATPSKKTISSSRTQELWWIYPEGDYLALSENQEKFRVVWGAQVSDQFKLELADEMGVQQKFETREREAFLPAPPSGEYTLTLSAGGKTLRKKFTIESLRPPSWLPLEKTASQIELRWRAATTGETEVSLQDTEAKSSLVLVNADRLAIPVEPGKKKVLAARARTKTRQGFTSWSEPFLLEIVGEPVKLKNEPDREQVQLIASREGAMACEKPFQWNSDANRLLIIAPDGKTWIHPLTTAQSTFCPYEPGDWVFQLRKEEPDGRVSALSPSKKLRANLAPPQLETPALRSFGNGEYVLRPAFPLTHPVEAELEDQKGKKRVVRLANFGEPFKIESSEKKIRMKYVGPSGETAWSEQATVIAPPSHRRSGGEDGGDESLRVKALDSGPTLTSGDSKLIWAELRWTTNARALRYEVEVSAEGRFEGEQTSRKVGANKLFLPFETAKNFFWRVRAVSSDGAPGPWTKVIAATIQAVNPKSPSVTTRLRPDSSHRRAPARSNGDQGSQTKK